MLIYANPSPKRKPGKPVKRTSATGRKAAPTKGALAMAKKHRSAAQKAATARMLAANKSRKRKKHRNPSSPASYRKRSARRAGTHRKRHRNPSSGGGGNFFRSFLTMESAVELGAAIAAPLAVDFVQQKIMPSATGITKLGIKAALAVGGGWAIDKFLKKRLAGKIFAVVGLSVIALDAWRYYQASGSLGLSEGEADYLSTRPELMDALVATDTSVMRPLSDGYGVNLTEPYAVNLTEPYSVNMSDAFSNPFG